MAGGRGNARAVTILDRALAQIPLPYIERLEILVRSDSVETTHELADVGRAGALRFSVGYELTRAVRDAIREIPADAWVRALDPDRARENGEMAENTGSVDRSSWPEGSRLIVRRERPNPGAQPSFTDHDGSSKWLLPGNATRGTAGLPCLK